MGTARGCLPNQELALLGGLDPDSFDRDEWLAISYAQALAEGDFADADSELADEMERRSALPVEGGRERADA